MSRLPRSVVRALQRAARHEPAQGLARRTFRATAELVARDLARIPSVRTVHLTGSWVRPETAAPGYSDLDLLLVVEVPTLDDELRLRDGIERVQRRWNVAANLLKHVDYVEHRDVPLLLRGGTEYWLDASHRFLPLGGAREPMPAGHEHRHRQVIRLESALKRWLRVSQVLLDRRFVRDEAITRRAAHRLSSGIAADRCDEGSYLPLERSFAADARGLPELSGIALATADAPLDRVIETHAAAALAMLEAMCRRAEVDDVVASPHAVPHRAQGETASLDREARRLGFSGCVVLDVPEVRDGGVGYVFADEPPLEAVRRMRALLPSLPWPASLTERGILRPALVTRPLVRHASLFPPALHVGDALLDVGTPFGPVPAALASTRRAIVEERSLALLYRPRGHRFRVERPPTLRAARLLEDVTIEAPRLAAARAGVAQATRSGDETPRDERSALEALRRAHESIRADVAPALGLPVRGSAR